MITVDLNGFKKHINPVYLKYLKDYRRWQIYKGGAGAGKSVFITQKIIYNTILPQIFNTMVTRKVGKDNFESTFQEMQKTINSLGFEDLFKINHSRGMESITYKPNKNKIIFKGLDDVEKVKSVTFETGDLTCIWTEEMSELLETDIEQLNIRLRGKGKVPKHLIGSFNPIDIDHWLKKRFFDNPIKNGYVCETTYKDNNFLADADKDTLEGYKERDNYYYMVYCLNQWGSRSTARIFHNIKFIKEHDERILRNIRYGLDFGFNDPNCLVGSGWYDGCLYIFKEFYGSKMINRDFIDIVENSEFEKDYVIIADSSRPDLIEEWNRAGFEVYASKKGKDSVEKGVDFLKQIPYIYIDEVACPNTAREFRIYKYRELKDGRILDEPVDLDNHTIDAVRYANEDLQEDVKPVFTRGLF